MQVNYQLSAEGRNKQFIETGRRPLSNQAISYDDTDLTPEQRQISIDAPRTGIVKLLRLATLDITPATIPNEIPRHANGAIKRFGAEKPELKATDLKFDAEPDRDAVFAILKIMTERAALLAPELAFEKERYDAYKLLENEAIEKFRIEDKAKQERLNAEKAARKEAERQALLNIEWREDNTAIHNLHDAIFVASGLKKDSRFNSWIKRINAVDMTKENGYCFEGGWINDQTVVAKREPAVFLAASTTGSRQYRDTNYVIVVMTAEGKLEKTEIATDDTDRGWALRIREQVAALL